MGSGLQSAVNGASQGCEDACVNSINGWVSSSSGKQMMTMEHLVCLLFRFQDACLLLSEVADKKGEVYHTGCEYVSSADVCLFPRILDAQLCPGLCDPMDSSPSGSSIHGMLQARKLERVVISYFRGSSWPWDGAQLSCISSNAKRILYCRVTWEVPYLTLKSKFSLTKEIIFTCKVLF